MMTPGSNGHAAQVLAVKVAAIEFRAIPSDKALNQRRLFTLVSQAAANEAKIIVLPELCTTGLNILSREEAMTLAETIPGPSTAAFASLARRHQLHIILGLAETDSAGQKFYNSQVVIGPDGRVAGTYRKMHLFGPDLHWAQKGDLGYQAVATKWGRIGLGICCDINYWELMGFLSGNQVDIFAFSTNWVGDELPFPYWSEMVAGGGYHLVAANNWGDEGGIHFTGGSVIQSPNGSVLSHTSAAADLIIYADISLRASC